MKNWIAKSTGNMTLSVLDEDGFQILKIDMLSYNTMKYGTDGEILSRALNDLTVIAHFSDGDYDISENNRKFGDVQISDLPWHYEYNAEKRKLMVGNQEHRIADRIYSKSVPQEKIDDIILTIRNGIEQINQSNFL